MREPVSADKQALAACMMAENPPATPESSENPFMPNGAIYILTQNDRYVNLALQSLASLKRVMPDLPVTVFSQFPISCPLIERVVPIEPSRDGFYDKTKLIRQSPYERTIFIDADIYVAEAFPELFALLDRFDIAATHEEYVDTDWFHRYPRKDIPSSFPEFNTGILLYRRGPQTDAVMKAWEDSYAEYLAQKPGQPINDQPFFRAAVYFSDARVATLTREYNCKFRGQGYLNGTVKILHGHVDLQLDPLHVGQASRVLNASQRPRVYIAGRVYDQKLTGRLVSMRKPHWIGTFPLFPGSLTARRMTRLRQIISEQGFRGIVGKLLGKSRGASSASET